jgi:hypothetical protein
MSKLINLPVAKAKDIPAHLRNFLKLDPEQELPQLPAQTRQELNELATQAFLRYIMIPNLVTDPLTDAEKKKLPAFQVLAYNIALAIKSEDCPWNERKEVLDRVLGSPIQKTESVQVSGNVKDWQESMKASIMEMLPELEEAKRLVKQKHERATNTP